MDSFLKVLTDEVGKLQYEFLDVKVTLSDGRVISKSATSEVEVRRIIRDLHKKERKRQSELLRKYNPDIVKVLTNLRDEIVDICENYKDSVKLSMINLKDTHYTGMWDDRECVCLHAIRLEPNTGDQIKINIRNESKQKECANKIYELVDDKYIHILQAYKIKYSSWDMAMAAVDTLIKITSTNTVYENFWISLWDKYYEEPSNKGGFRL